MAMLLGLLVLVVSMKLLYQLITDFKPPESYQWLIRIIFVAGVVIVIATVLLGGYLFAPWLQKQNEWFT
jgi:hypothetical protein